MTPLLEVEDLRVELATSSGVVHAVDGVSFHVAEGETLGIVGESGCGKTMTALALQRMLPRPGGRIAGGSIRLGAEDLMAKSEAEMRAIRGRDIAMILQDPMSSLNPVMSVGAQIDDILMRHTGLSRRAARRRTIELLDLVGIREPAQRADDHPHQFSGGMRQRVLIAIAVSCQPALLIADEPTTALDVTVQAQILRLLMRLRRELGMALMLITHDFGVIAGMVERVYVMNGGAIVETGPTDALFAAPQHEYTRALLAAVPRIEPGG